MRRTFVRLAASPLLLVLLVGCAEDFDPATLIAGPRVLGARAEIEGDDSGRAWPRPDERVRVPWLMAFAEQRRPITAGFVACPAAPVRFGRAFCDGPMIPTTACPGTPPGQPCGRVDLAQANLGDRGELLVLGGVCAGGNPSFDPEERTFACEGTDDPEAGQAVAFRIPLQRGETTNRHPQLDSIELEGEPWGEPPSDVRDRSPGRCPSDLQLPSVGAGEEVSLAIGPTSDSHEPLPPDSDMAEVRDAEEIQISHFADAGEMDRQFSFVERGEPPATVTWKAPNGVGQGGRLVRFYVVLRDGRAGLAWAVRALCVR